MPNACTGVFDGGSAALAAATVAAVLAALVPLPARAEDPPAKTPPAMCWTPDRLAHRPGEQLITRRAPTLVPARRRALPASHLPLGRGQAIRRVKLPPGQNLVALTFDLCEQPTEISGYQGSIVDFLRANGVKATFFAGGKWMLSHKERAKQLMADPLFEVGNHTWEHRNLRLLDGAPLTDEVEKAQVAYEQVRDELARAQCLTRDGARLAHQQAPPRMDLFRFPFGACNDKSLAAVAELGLTAIQWDVSAGDPWPRQTSEIMTQAVLRHVRPGSIVLFHANGRGWHTPEALPAIVAELKRRGFGFVTVSELLRAGEPVAEPVCYDFKRGDTDRYDSLARRLELMYQQARQKAQSVAGTGAQAPPASVPIPEPARRPASRAAPETGPIKDTQN
jgi:peptidoglycan/xylan/chitin deacetylase (PgdA/CDA1 family)